MTDPFWIFAAARRPVWHTYGCAQSRYGLYPYSIVGERLTMSLAGGGVWSDNYDVPTVTIQPKDDPNSASRMLSKITDD